MIEWEEKKMRAAEERFGMLTDGQMQAALEFKRRFDRGEDIGLYGLLHLALVGTKEAKQALNEFTVSRDERVGNFGTEQAILNHLHEERFAIDEEWNRWAPACEKARRWAEADGDEKNRDFWQQNLDELKAYVELHYAAIAAQEARVERARACWDPVKETYR